MSDITSTGRTELFASPPGTEHNAFDAQQGQGSAAR